MPVTGIHVMILHLTASYRSHVLSYTVCTARCTHLPAAPAEPLVDLVLRYAPCKYNAVQCNCAVSCCPVLSCTGITASHRYPPVSGSADPLAAVAWCGASGDEPRQVVILVITLCLLIFPIIILTVICSLINEHAAQATSSNTVTESNDRLKAKPAA